MKKLILAAGVAALAISAPTLADPGGKGGGKGGKGADRAQVDQRGGGKPMKADRAEKAWKAQEKRAEKGFEAREKRAEKAFKAQEKRVEQSWKAQEKRAKAEEKWAKQRSKAEDKAVRADRKAIERRIGSDRLEPRFWDGDRFDRRLADRGYPAGLVDGCPPGLAKKSPACIPPGQARQHIGQRVGAIGGLLGLPAGLGAIYPDNDDYYYRYGDGYLYRVDRDTDLVRSLMPLFGLGLGIGQPFPFDSQAYRVPSYYQPFYPEGGDDRYRYANGYIYEVDGRSGLIEDIIPLYDRGYGVGQMLPSSYSYYNLPDAYRGYYSDSDDYYYRYAPGAIYQVDRKTQLITALASLLTGTNGLSVGSQLPMGYSAYNVPLDYRDRYYDTPDNWYRYADGNIYQVDPQTRLITAIIDAIV